VKRRSDFKLEHARRVKVSKTFEVRIAKTAREDEGMMKS